jgi:hypothetical protein
MGSFHGHKIPNIHVRIDFFPFLDCLYAPVWIQYNSNVDVQQNMEK